MFYCQNCGNQLSDDSKFCAKCGTPQNNQINSATQQNYNNQQFSSYNSISFNRGKEIAVSYCNYKLAGRYKFLTIYNLILFAVGLIMLFLYDNIFDTDAIFPLLIIGIICLALSSTMYSIQFMICQNNNIHIHENCIIGTAAVGLTSKSFEAPYRNIADVRVITKKKGIEYLQISIRNNSSNELNVFPCYVCDCYTMMSNIQKKMNH